MTELTEEQRSQLVHFTGTQSNKSLCGERNWWTGTHVPDKVSCPECRELIFHGPELVKLTARMERLEEQVARSVELVTRALKALNAELPGKDPGGGT